MTAGENMITRLLGLIYTERKLKQLFPKALI